MMQSRKKCKKHIRCIQSKEQDACKTNICRGIFVTHGAEPSAKYALPEKYEVPATGGRRQSAGAGRRAEGKT